MSIRYDFRNPKELVKFIVGESILESMTEEKRKNTIERVSSVIKKYRGSELLACDILSRSAEKGKLEEYLRELEMHYYHGNIQYLSPSIRLSVY